jgi:Fe-S-cluster containining protein
MTSFYSGGLRFSCTRCSACCRYESGFVFLSQKDLSILAKALKMGYTDFMEAYCRWVPAGRGVERLSLKEKSNYDCIFWNRGCGVYEERPLQCRAYPFWPGILALKETWEGADCPGINRGKLHTKEEIETWLGEQRSEPVISRRVESMKP